MSAEGGNGSVAIVGMACMFPGAPNLDAYWSNILDKVDATSDPPPESWDPDVYYDGELHDPDRTYCKRGGYLGALAEFEPLAYGIPPVSVGGEPDQWLALEVAYAALADAGATELPEEIRARTAIVLGKGTYLNGGNAIAVQRGLVVGQTIDLIRRLHPEHTEAELDRLREELQRTLPPLSPETVPGLIPNIIVGRIANRLDLMGPAYTVDAACASSLIAVQQAVRDLVAGEIDLALAGGSQVWMPVATMNLFCRLGALSRRQQLRAFDQDADGTLLGEGIGMAVLKRLEDAVRDGDRVYAAIRGVGASSDGHGASVMAPRVEGEELALRRAYASAGVSPLTVGLVEAHGTGTPVGDVAELQALTRVFGERTEGLPRCALGSVKSMISHTIPAAGIAGLIKAALALHHRVLPPTLNVERPNPKLELERTHFYLNTETRPWIHGGSEPRRAGINAFGFGGINAHAVLEEFTGACTTAHQPPWESELCLLEGESPPALVERAQELASVLDASPRSTLTELASALHQDLGDGSGQRRLAVVALSLEDLRKKLALAIEKLRDPGCERIKTVNGIYYEAEPFGAQANVVLVFPGEGAQYPNMLSDLCLRFREAREVFDRIDRLYADHPRGHLLSDWVFPRPAFSDAERRHTEARLMDLDIAVESVLTANAAVHAVLRRLLPRVDAMLGHSTGEHSAALAAGALDLDRDENLARFCHGLNASYADAASRHEVPGAVLLAIGAGAAEVREIAELARGELYLAMDNCPHQAVLVGDGDAIARAQEIATGRGLMSEQLPYDRAVHTPMFAPFAEDLRAIFAQLPVRPPSTALWSCTTTAPYPVDPLEIRELLVEHWTSPVRFRETIEALYADGARFFVEAGPRGNLTAFIEDILRGHPFCAVAADQRRRRGETQLNHLAGMLATHLLKVDVGYLFAGRASGELDWRRPPTAQPRRPAKVPLSMSWPMLRLSDDALERLRTAPSDTGGRNGDGNGAAPSRSPLPAAPVIAAAAGPAAAVAQVDPADAVIDRHLETMERFLHTGSEVMQAYLGGAVATLIEQRRRPLVGTISSLEPERRLVARRTLDLDEDLYLRHHTLGRGVSRSDPDLTALALMPLAMSLEVLAETASCLFADLVVTGLRDVRAHRWLIVGEQPHTLEVRARRLIPGTNGAAGERVRVELHEPDRPDASGPVVEGTVVLAPCLPAAPTAAGAPLAGGRPCRFSPAGLYGEVMFHQPLWQGVESVDLVASEGAKARLKVLPRTGLLRGSDAPDFVMDPVLLDAAGQVIGFWAADRLERGAVVFPFRLEALDLYAPPPAAGESLECSAAIELVGEQLVRSDIEVSDADGGVRLRLSNWEDKRFTVPERFAPLTSPGAIEALSSPWPAAAAPYAGRPVACRRLDLDLGADGGLWKQVWAARVLGRRERELFAALHAPEHRQLAWLAGRTAAKDAVADLLRSAGGPDLPPADIEILPDEHGRPVVAVPSLHGLVAVVSISHSDGEACALAALAPDGVAHGVGIDIERIVPRPAGFAEAALSEPERRLLEPLPHVDEWLLRCWCAKEAAGKASGRGLGQGAMAPAVAAIDPERELALVDVAGRRIVVHTWREDSLIVAATLAEEGGEPR